MTLEWINVTAGFETATMGAVSPGVYDSGFVFATASCQQVGLNGFARDPQGLRQWDPERYESLSIEGDSSSYDIFSQAGRALGPERARKGADPLAGLGVHKVIAIGASQSAIRLRTYINAIQPTERVFDAIVTTLDFGRAMGFDDWVHDPMASSPAEGPPRLFRTQTRIRDDQATPVMVVNSEFETLSYLPSRQPDSDSFRFWEIADASHVPAPDGRRQALVHARDGVKTGFQLTGGSEVLRQPTADAAVDHVHRWINGGPPPPVQARIEIKEGPRPEIARDDHGNARGGVRPPELEMPIARYSGAAEGPGFLAGATSPFPPEKVERLYPSREDYVDRVTAAAKAAERSGVITARRAAEYVQEARAVAWRARNPAAR